MSNSRIAGGGQATDHDNLTNRGNDAAHTQFPLLDGTRAFTGVQTGVAPTSDLHLATKKYVDDNSGGSGNMLYFRAVKSSTVQATTGAFVDITNWTEANADSPYSFNATTGELTFSETGLYMAIIDVQGEDNAGNRTQLEVEMQLSPLGVGYASQAEMIWRNYSSRNGTQSAGGVHGSFIREFTANDLIKFRVQDVGNPANINQSKARLYLVKMAF